MTVTRPVPDRPPRDETTGCSVAGLRTDRVVSSNGLASHVGAPIDANGSLTADGTRTFEWDAPNQLVAIDTGISRQSRQYTGPMEGTSLPISRAGWRGRLAVGAFRQCQAVLADTVISV